MTSLGDDGDVLVSDCPCLLSVWCLTVRVCCLTVRLYPTVSDCVRLHPTVSDCICPCPWFWCYRVRGSGVTVSVVVVSVVVSVVVVSVWSCPWSWWHRVRGPGGTVSVSMIEKSRNREILWLCWLYDREIEKFMIFSVFFKFNTGEWSRCTRMVCTVVPLPTTRVHYRHWACYTVYGHTGIRCLSTNEWFTGLLLVTKENHKNMLISWTLKITKNTNINGFFSFSYYAQTPKCRKVYNKVSKCLNFSKFSEINQKVSKTSFSDILSKILSEPDA